MGTGQAATTLPPRDTTEAVSVGPDHLATGGTRLYLRSAPTGAGLHFADTPVVPHDRVAKTDAVLFTAEDQCGRSLDLTADGRYSHFYTDDVSDGGTFGNHPRLHRYT